ncbi:hypothetical protein E2320_003571, partial [Naja naja]
MLITLVILWLLVDMKCEADATPCPQSVPSPILHEWYKPGNLLIGVITAQVIYVLEEHSFEEHPSHKSFLTPLWKWVGLLILDDNSGDNFLQALDPLLSKNRICSAFVERFPKQAFLFMFEGDIVHRIQFYLNHPRVNTLIFYGESIAAILLFTFMKYIDIIRWDISFHDPMISVTLISAYRLDDDCSILLKSSVLNSILVYQQVLPLSVCNDPCPAGYQKKKKEGKKFCCYDCDPCSDGKMSNMS